MKHCITIRNRNNEVIALDSQKNCRNSCLGRQRRSSILTHRAVSTVLECKIIVVKSKSMKFSRVFFREKFPLPARGI